MQMKKLSQKELLVISGGTSAALITAVVKIFTTVFDIGRKIGSTIRRRSTKNYC